MLFIESCISNQVRLSNFNLFRRLYKVEKLRQTPPISFPVFFQSLSPLFRLITI